MIIAMQCYNLIQLWRFSLFMILLLFSVEDEDVVEP